MFSSRIGFMRPKQGAPDPDEPVIPDPIPGVYGSTMFTTKAGSGASDYLQWNNSYMEAHPFNDLVGRHWNMITCVLGPKNGALGSADWNGEDTTQYASAKGDTTKPPPYRFGSAQDEFNQFVVGCWMDGLGNTPAANARGNQIGTPMYVRDLIIHNGMLSLSDQQKIQGWMCHEAGLQNILQSDHPYKSQPPSGFTPADVNPRAWWHSESGFSGTGASATWTSQDGNHTLVKAGGFNATPRSHDNFNQTQVDGLTVIDFENDWANYPQQSNFTGCKYSAHSVATGADFMNTGMTIQMLVMPRDIPDRWTADIYASNQYAQKNASIFNFQSGGSKHYALTYEVSSQSVNRNTQISDDPPPGVGNTMIDSGNVSV